MRHLPNPSTDPPAQAETAWILDPSPVPLAEPESRHADVAWFFDLSQDIMGLATLDGRFIRINPAFERMFGHRGHALWDRNFLMLVHPDDRHATAEAMARLKVGGNVLDFVNRCRGPDGSYRWLEWRISPCQGEFIHAIARDVSRLKQAEAELHQVQEDLEHQVQRRTEQLHERTRQLRTLAGTVILAEERERTRISRLIHDHLQQMLVAALLNLKMLKARGGHAEQEADFESIQSMLKDCIETAHTLTAELSPAVLYQYGLAAALHWLRPWCMEKYRLLVDVDAEDDIDPCLEVSVTLFLCVRELLFNTVKHAGVKVAAVSMWRNPPDGMLKIMVSDKGAGFDPQAAKILEGPAGGIGLFNSRERMEMLGGGMEIESSPGGGSRFTLWVPSVPVTSDPSPVPDAR